MIRPTDRFKLLSCTLNGEGRVMKSSATMSPKGENGMPSGYAILAWKILLTNSSTGSRERALLQIDEANAKMRRYKIKLAARVILRIGRSRLRVGQTLGLRTEKTRDPVRGAAPMIVSKPPSTMNLALSRVSAALPRIFADLR